MLSISDYVAQLQAEQEKANAANEARLKEATALYDETIKSFAPGGSFGANVENQLATSKTKALSSGTQALVNSGFANSDMVAQLGNTFEKEVGAPTRLTLESERQAGINAAKTAKAGLIERVNDVGPDNSLIAQLLQNSASPTGKVTTTAPSKLKLDSSSGSPDTSWDAAMAAWRAGGTVNNSQTSSTSSGTVSQTPMSMSNEDITAWANYNINKKKTNIPNYWPEG